MLLILYLGNYNLVEGNSVSKTEAMAYLAKNSEQETILKTEKPDGIEKSSCNIDELDQKQQLEVMNGGGAANPNSENITRSAQLNATLCSKSGMIK